MKHIVLVEDEALIRAELTVLLERGGYEVSAITSFRETTEQILSYRGADLVLLDLNLPGESGFEVCRALKARSSLPILVLTSRDQLTDELRALKLGADEYLTKPFRKERLLARIENLLKRYEGRGNLLEGEDFLLDRKTYTLYRDGDSCVLPNNQGKLLEAFVLARGEVVTKDDLSLTLWDTTQYIDENALQVNIARLKKVMRDAGMRQRIESVRGVGYRMVRGTDDGANDEEIDEEADGEVDEG